MLRAILILAQTLIFPITVFYIIGTAFRIFPIAMPLVLLGVSVMLGLSWWLVICGRWRIARIFPMLLPYAVATYVAFSFNTGMISGLMYALSIIAATILVQGRTGFIVALADTLTIASVQGARLAGILPPEKNFIDFFAASTTSTFFNLILILALMYFFKSEYQRAFLTALEKSTALEHTNQTLLEEIEQRNTLEAELQQSLSEKEVLLKEIHHRVKNNLQTVASLLFLQARKSDSAEATRILQESYNRVQSMALIHQQLYQTTNLSHINLATYVETLLSQIHDSYIGNGSMVKIVKDVEAVYFNLDTIIPIGLILNELISNAMKHAFPAGHSGTITIRFHLENGHNNLSVIDSGVGLSATQRELVAANGLTALSENSLGLTLVQQLAKQLHGTITIHSNAETEFRLVF